MNVLIVADIFIVVMLFFFYASYSIRSGVYLTALYKNPKVGKAIALTFDDGPDADQTPKVLDILQKNDIKGCFFCIGKNVVGNEDIIRRIKAEGHLLGNHSYSHSGKFPLYSSNKMVEDVLKCSIEIEKILEDKVRFFRPPFGVTNPTIAKTVKKLSLTTIGWNIRTLDTCIKNEKKVLNRIEKRLKPGSVILLHDNLKSSDTMLNAIISLIREKGYKFVGIDELFNLN
ncbi:MAG: polysaccharide deacetylase family protein [Prevotellaceae bacterium]|jgi:peptidoglycan/xylan/chitin deacetylase (PgdA/CDA1 family)|nr:polysaccharide deacetylase family protein [Prevotellaceae bacterium]